MHLVLDLSMAAHFHIRTPFLGFGLETLGSSGLSYTFHCLVFMLLSV